MCSDAKKGGNSFYRVTRKSPIMPSCQTGCQCCQVDMLKWQCSFGLTNRLTIMSRWQAMPSWQTGCQCCPVAKQCQIAKRCHDTLQCRLAKLIWDYNQVANYVPLANNARLTNLANSHLVKLSCFESALSCLNTFGHF